MGDDKAAIKHELLASIEDELRRAEAAAPPHAKLLERYNPEKAARILFLHAQGKSQTCLCKKYGYRLRHFETQSLRKENDRTVAGGLYLLDF